MKTIQPIKKFFYPFSKYHWWATAHRWGFGGEQKFLAPFLNKWKLVVPVNSYYILSYIILIFRDNWKWDWCSGLTTGALIGLEKIVWDITLKKKHVTKRHTRVIHFYSNFENWKFRLGIKITYSESYLVKKFRDKHKLKHPGKGHTPRLWWRNSALKSEY